MVNDDGSTSETYLRRLQHEGYLVTRTADPAEALVLAKQSTPQIQMIFVNIGRGGSGSSIFLQALRSNDQTRHIPVTILSSYYSRTLEDLNLGLTQVSRHGRDRRSCPSADRTPYVSSRLPSPAPSAALTSSKGPVLSNTRSRRWPRHPPLERGRQGLSEVWLGPCTWRTLNDRGRDGSVHALGLVGQERDRAGSLERRRQWPLVPRARASATPGQDLARVGQEPA
jgi:CheY-like chemotaxis protein